MVQIFYSKAIFP